MAVGTQAARSIRASSIVGATNATAASTAAGTSASAFGLGCSTALVVTTYGLPRPGLDRAGVALVLLTAGWAIHDEVIAVRPPFAVLGGFPDTGCSPRREVSPVTRRGAAARSRDPHRQQAHDRQAA